MQDSEAEHSSYLQTEFFFYFLPSYYAIVAFLIRYNKIIKQPIETNAPLIPGQSGILCLEEQSSYLQNLSTRPPPASYTIKLKLCLINSYIYVMMVVLGILGNQQIFYACKHKTYSIIYLLGFLSWSLAAIVLRREYQRKIPQSLWTHRFFWIFSGTFAITKMFQDYLLPLNIVFNSLLLATNIILIVYGLFRPENNDTLVLLHNEELPNFIKWFFQYFQLNPFVRKVFKIEEAENIELKEALNQELEEEDIKQIEQSLKMNAQSMKKQIDLLNTLPRRNIFIDKKLRYVQTQKGIFKYYYFIFTQIGTSRFQVERTFSQFQELQNQLLYVFSQRNFPSLKLPRIPKVQKQGQNYSQTLQSWLSEVLKKPIFIIKPILYFLNINEESSAPFLTYFEYTHKSFCSKAYLVACLKRKKQKKERQTRIGYFEEDKIKIQLASLIKQSIQYKVQVDMDSTTSAEYVFEITATPQNRDLQVHRWKVRKPQDHILQLNSKIQEECKISVSFYYLLVTESQGKYYQKKAYMYAQYLKKLLQNQKYFCFSLFQFLKFDPINREVRLISRASLTSSTGFKQQRPSHYMESYQEQGNFIEVLRVDRLQKNRFQLVIKRKGFQLKKKSEQLQGLRKQLVQVYRGVNFVPDISFKECNKIEAKERAEDFLLKLQSLPKISINEEYLSFYEHTI